MWVHNQYELQKDNNPQFPAGQALKPSAQFQWKFDFKELQGELQAANPVVRKGLGLFEKFAIPFLKGNGLDTGKKTITSAIGNTDVPGTYKFNAGLWGGSSVTFGVGLEVTNANELWEDTKKRKFFTEKPLLPQPGISIGMQYTQSTPIGVLKFGAGGGYNANRNVFDAKIAVEFDFSKYFHAGAEFKIENIGKKTENILEVIPFNMRR